MSDDIKILDSELAYPFPYPAELRNDTLRGGFEELRGRNIMRQAEWPGVEKVTIPYRAMEVGGEGGELLNAVKKYVRIKQGIAGNSTGIEIGGARLAVANEAADVVICIDLLLNDLGIDLGEAVQRKFNATSHKLRLVTEI